MEPALLICMNYSTTDDDFFDLHIRHWHILPNLKIGNSCGSPAHWGPCTFSWRPQQTPTPSWSQTGPGCGRRPPVMTFRITDDITSGKPVCAVFLGMSDEKWVILYFISRLLDNVSPRLLGLVLVPAHHVDRSTCDKDGTNTVLDQVTKTLNIFKRKRSTLDLLSALCDAPRSYCYSGLFTSASLLHWVTPILHYLDIVLCIVVFIYWLKS